MTYAAAMTIEELNPGGLRIRLQGSALPLITGATWTTAQKVVTKWLPGNGVDAVQQSLGARVMPSQFSGSWHSTLLNRSPVVVLDGATGAETALVTPYRVREVFEGVLKRGSLLRVIFEVTGSTIRAGSSSPRPEDMRIVRVGRMSSFSTPIQRHSDIDWTMDFDWKGTGGEIARVDQSNDEADIARAVNTLLRATDTYVDAIAGAVRNPLTGYSSPVTIGRLQTLVAAPSKAVDRFKRALVQNSNSLKDATKLATDVARGLTPRSLRSAAKQLSREIVFDSAESIRDVARIPFESRSTQDDLAAQIRAHVIAEREANAIEALGRIAQDTDQTIGGNPGSRGTLGVHVVRAGQTMITISVIWYKSADYAGEICRANRLPWGIVAPPVGTALVIPVVTAGASK